MDENCRRCGRKLRSAKSLATGYGPICRLRIAIAIPAGTTQAQLEKALTLIDDDGVIITNVGRRKNAVFRTVASNGVDKYLTATNACSCPAGRAERLCYHRVAVALVLA